MENKNWLNELDDAEIDSLMKYVIPFSEENSTNIKTKFVQKAGLKKKKLSLKKITILVAAVTALAASTLVYAKIIDFSRIYKIVFGDNSEYVDRYIKPLVDEKIVVPEKNESQSVHADSESQTLKAAIESEYDGIVFRLLSVLNDGDVLRIFATMQDTTGDRLNDRLDFGSWGLSQGHGGNMSVIDYDRETKTATLLITSLGDSHEGSATLSVNGFTTGFQSYEGLKENKINAYEILRDYTPQTVNAEEVWVNGGAFQNPVDSKAYGFYRNEGGTKPVRNFNLLKPDEKKIIFKNVDWSYISNIGFVDGCLHIQTVKSSDNGNELASIDFVNMENETVAQGHLTLYHTDIENRRYNHATEPYSQYKEMIYKEITDIEQLKELSMVIDVVDMGNAVEGNWEFSFEISKKITTDFKVGKEIIINGEPIKIDMVSLSPLGVTMNLPDNIAHDYKHEDVAYVTYDDGTIIKLNETSIGGYEDLSTLKFDGNIVEIEKVKNIVINDEIIAVE